MTYVLVLWGEPWAKVWAYADHGCCDVLLKGRDAGCGEWRCPVRPPRFADAAAR
ncbi:hypothetical protein Misp01_62490 [Microtetraspora sp. NBRC 13810]|uniref:hypothetical protein n=1 Tax=Microtetraspora sp. NBRC 13810 TaxID=3030990 RepID=UPI0024A5F0D0|nr:hypothetical protein [Microtetraspora sp. NBRC 13810]GLW11121.1 hypothetical protein Misp01_62490 [Microtetraspora sp. NBRC 13810]